MTGNIIARRYAHAMFSLASEHDATDIDKYSNTLNSLNEMLEASSELKILISAPIISPMEKYSVIDALLSRIEADQTIKNFCKLLAEKNRLPMLPNIVCIFNELIDMHKGVTRGEVITAIELSDEQKSNCSNKLEQRTNCALRMKYSVDPNILGGVIVHLGNTTIDASLKAQLNSLINAIKRG